ncbi:MAG: hypothetical protein EXS17_06925 [Phycisphaerales bacterium]|nr:hypothetical protein [Phycisphaerales bacterium]
MSATHLRSMTLEAFMDALAAKQPVPGGGAAAAVLLAQAAALGSMVIAYTLGKPKFAEHEGRLRQYDNLLAAARSEALDLGDRDADAYLALNTLWKIPASDRATRSDWHSAVSEAIAAPAAIVDLAASVLAVLAAMTGITATQLASDLIIARRFSHTALESALANVQVNLPQVTDLSQRTAGEAFVAARRAEGSRLAGGGGSQAAQS